MRYGAGDAFDSRWYSWPLAMRGVYFSLVKEAAIVHNFKEAAPLVRGVRHGGARHEAARHHCQHHPLPHLRHAPSEQDQVI